MPGAWCLVVWLTSSLAMCLDVGHLGSSFLDGTFGKVCGFWHLLAIFPHCVYLCVSVYIYVGMESVHFHMFLVIFGLAFLRFSSGVHFGLGWDGVVLVSGHLKEGERVGNGILRNSGVANILAVCREKRGP